MCRIPAQLKSEKNYHCEQWGQSPSNTRESEVSTGCKSLLLVATSVCWQSVHKLLKAPGALWNYPVLKAQWLHWVNYRKTRAKRHFFIFKTFCYMWKNWNSLKNSESTFRSLSKMISGCSGKTETFMTFALAVVAQNCSSGTCTMTLAFTEAVRDATSALSFGYLT